MTRRETKPDDGPESFQGAFLQIRPLSPLLLPERTSESLEKQSNGCLLILEVLISHACAQALHAQGLHCFTLAGQVPVHCIGA